MTAASSSFSSSAPSSSSSTDPSSSSSSDPGDVLAGARGLDDDAWLTAIRARIGALAPWAGPVSLAALLRRTTRVDIHLTAPVTCPSCARGLTGRWLADRDQAAQQCDTCGEVWSAACPLPEFDGRAEVAFRDRHGLPGRLDAEAVGLEPGTAQRDAEARVDV